MFSWKWISDVVDAAVNLVDKAVPAFVGSRTKIAVVACPIIGVAGPIVSGLFPPAAPVASLVSHVLCPVAGTAAVTFAAAGLLRK